jgi:hypothetical protein
MQCPQPDMSGKVALYLFHRGATNMLIGMMIREGQFRSRQQVTSVAGL